MGSGDHASIVHEAFSAQAAGYDVAAVTNLDWILEEIVRRTRPRPGDRWLDAACGTGIVSRRLAPLVRAVRGVDLTAAMIDVARARAIADELANLTYAVGDATASGLPPDSCDGAVTRFSVHHIPLPGRLLAEMARVVRPGGTVVVADHLADDDAESRAWAQEIERLRDPAHWAARTAAELRALGAAAGLELLDEYEAPFELGFVDWLRRGTDDPLAHQLVERALDERPGGSDAFAVRAGPSGRVLRLRLWIGVWERSH